MFQAQVWRGGLVQAAATLHRRRQQSNIDSSAAASCCQHLLVWVPSHGRSLPGLQNLAWGPANQRLPLQGLLYCVGDVTQCVLPEAAPQMEKHGEGGGGERAVSQDIPAKVPEAYPKKSISAWRQRSFSTSKRKADAARSGHIACQDDCTQPKLHWSGGKV